MYGLNTSVSVGSVVFVFYTDILKNGNFKFFWEEKGFKVALLLNASQLFYMD